MYLELTPMMSAIQGKEPKPASVPPTTRLSSTTALSILQPLTNMFKFSTVHILAG
jgi:hypothetical protein